LRKEMNSMVVGQFLRMSKAPGSIESTGKDWSKQNDTNKNEINKRNSSFNKPIKIGLPVLFLLVFS
jgi:hypothetical protein